VGSERARPVVLDTGALIAFERNDRRVRTLIELALANRGELHVPAGVVAQAWRDGARQARVARLLSSGSVAVTALDDEEARAVGVLCRKTGAFDVIDASVALLARRHAARIVTSDPGDIRRIDPELELVLC
jgi:predicted nucleic acid-binding protein